MILLILFLLSGGAASTIVANVQGQTPKAIVKVIKKEVADDARRDAAIAAVKMWAKLDKQQDKALASARKGLLKVVQKDGATPADAAPLTARIDASIAESNRVFLDMRFGVVSRLTKAEWDAAVVRLNK